MGNVARDATVGAVGAGFWGYVGAAEVPGYGSMSITQQFIMNGHMSSTFYGNMITAEYGVGVATFCGVGDKLYTGMQVYEYVNQTIDIYEASATR